LQRKKLVCLTAAAVFASAGSAFASSADAAQLTGAGSTLVAPLEQLWASGWQAQTGNTVQFSAIGSGKGITAISGNQVDFGASDAPMSSAQAAGCANCVTIPWALSATGIGYNLPGLGSKVRHLSRPDHALERPADHAPQQGAAHAEHGDHAGAPQ
jgi:phosphate transport system substrate-binding protein